MQSYEYDKSLKNVDFDISWLEEKLEFTNILKLEEIITTYNIQSHLTIFEYGFDYACKYFTSAMKGI